MQHNDGNQDYSLPSTSSRVPAGSFQAPPLNTSDVIMSDSCSGRGVKRKQPCDDQIGDDSLRLKELENVERDPDLDDNNDSDEEEVPEDKDLNTAIKAQEPATRPSYDDIQVTPFNLDDELEEGEFDKSGNFIFKEKDKIDETNNDTWAESIDWSRVKDNAVPVQEKEEPKEPETTIDPMKCYKQMLRIMKSDETVQKTIRRLGNDVPKRRPNKNKFKEPESPEATEARHKLDLMIESAHNLLENGDMDIYQKSYEDLEEAING